MADMETATPELIEKLAAGAEAGNVEPIATDDAPVRSQHFGEYLEASIASAGINTMIWALTDKLYTALYGTYGGPSPDPAGIAELPAVFDEFKALCLHIIDTIMTMPEADGVRAGEPAVRSLVEGLKAMRAGNVLNKANRADVETIITLGQAILTRSTKEEEADRSAPVEEVTPEVVTPRSATLDDLIAILREPITEQQ